MTNELFINNRKKTSVDLIKGDLYMIGVYTKAIKDNTDPEEVEKFMHKIDLYLEDIAEQVEALV